MRRNSISRRYMPYVIYSNSIFINLNKLTPPSALTFLPLINIFSRNISYINPRLSDLNKSDRIFAIERIISALSRYYIVINHYTTEGVLLVFA